MRIVRLRELNVGCFGGGTGLPSLIGGLKHNPWVHVHAVVTMFDSGGSSGQLRDQLGVLPPGDVLKCVLALAQNEAEARRILLSRLPGLENGPLSGHTSGNLLLSMMAQDGGDFLAAVDSLRALLDCHGRVWPVSIEHATVCAEYEDDSTASGEVAVDEEQSQGRRIRRVWLEPAVGLHPPVADAIRGFDAVIIGPGSFYTSLMPILLVEGVAEALRAVEGPIVLVTNILPRDEVCAALRRLTRSGGWVTRSGVRSTSCWSIAATRQMKPSTSTLPKTRNSWLWARCRMDAR